MSFLRGALFITSLYGAICFARNTESANPDSLFYQYTRHYSVPAENVIINFDENQKLGKCGTILALQIKDNFLKFTEEQQAVIKKINSGEILNNRINEGNIDELPRVDNPFPVPFSYKSNNLLYFPITNSDAGVAELNIYSSSMSSVYSGTPLIRKYFDKKVVSWNALDNSGGKLSSGVYIYIIKTANNLLKGKCVIIGD